LANRGNAKPQGNTKTIDATNERGSEWQQDMAHSARLLPVLCSQVIGLCCELDGFWR